jgi:serralysin
MSVIRRRLQTGAHYLESTGYTLGSTSYPQTLMMHDIAALQTMYGANYATNGGDTVYR